jgi:hypothetical protein
MVLHMAHMALQFRRELARGEHWRTVHWDMTERGMRSECRHMDLRMGELAFAVGCLWVIACEVASSHGRARVRPRNWEHSVFCHGIWTDHARGSRFCARVEELRSSIAPRKPNLVHLNEPLGLPGKKPPLPSVVEDASVLS